MKLSVNFMAKDKCYRAGDNIPDAEVPAFVARYMMANADADADSAGYAQGLRQQRANADQRTYEPEPVRTRQGGFGKAATGEAACIAAIRGPWCGLRAGQRFD
jgi:hypothetical protein